MRAYRETLSVTRPPALVARELCDRLGDPLDGSPADPPEGASDSTPADSLTRWRYRRLLYGYEVTLDPERGEVETVVTVSDAFRPVALGVLFATLLAVALGLSPEAYLLALWACALVALVPVVHLWPGVGAAPEVESARAVGRRLTAYGVPAYLGAMLALWAGLRAVRPAPVVDATVAVLGLVGLGAYYVGNGLGLDDRRISALGVPLSALLPALFATGNVVLATALLAGSGAGASPASGATSAPAHPQLAVALAGAGALAFDLAFLVYCRVALHSFAGARLVAPRSRLVRVAGAVCFLAVNAVLLVATLLAVRTLAVGVLAVPDLPVPAGGLIAPAYGTVDAALAPLPGPARPYSVGFYALLVAPVLYVAGGWAYYLLVGLGSRIAVLARTDRVTGRGLPDVPVFAVPGDVPRVRPVGRVFGLSGVVLVTEPVLDLADDELAAVVAHEVHHLQRRDLLVGALAGLAAVAVGGRNALLAFYDYPTAERAADAHAADRAGRDALVRALRRMEALRYDARRPASDGGAPSGSHPVGATEGASVTACAVAYLRAPYALYFGRVLLDGAHRDVDERIARL